MHRLHHNRGLGPLLEWRTKWIKPWKPYWSYRERVAGKLVASTGLSALYSCWPGRDAGAATHNLHDCPSLSDWDLHGTCSMCIEGNKGLYSIIYISFVKCSLQKSRQSLGKVLKIVFNSCVMNVAFFPQNCHGNEDSVLGFLQGRKLRSMYSCLSFKTNMVSPLKWRSEMETNLCCTN